MPSYPYEHRSQPLLPRRLFLGRLLWHVLVAFILLFVALGLGVLGYHVLERLSWLDSLLNASMILGGMGPVAVLQTPAGKLFASFYALFSGVIFLVVAGIVVAPIAHRLLHRLHLDEEKDADHGQAPRPKRMYRHRRKCGATRLHRGRKPIS